MLTIFALIIVHLFGFITATRMGWWIVSKNTVYISKTWSLSMGFLSMVTIMMVH